MSSKESLDVDSRSPSCDLEEHEHERLDLLKYERTSRHHERKRRRNWVFLAVNTFILLLNVGLILMMSSPRITNQAEDAANPRLPHAGQPITPILLQKGSCFRRLTRGYIDWIESALELEVQTYDDKFGIHGQFRGKPRPELDSAWADYVRSEFTFCLVLQSSFYL